MDKEQENEIAEILTSILDLKDEEYEMDDTSWGKDFVRIVVEDTDGGRYVIDGPFRVIMSGPELICRVLADD